MSAHQVETALRKLGLGTVLPQVFLDVEEIGDFIEEEKVKNLVQLAHGVGAEERLTAHRLSVKDVDAAGTCGFRKLGKEGCKHIHAVGMVAAEFGHFVHEPRFARPVGADYRYLPHSRGVHLLYRMDGAWQCESVPHNLPLY